MLTREEKDEKNRIARDKRKKAKEQFNKLLNTVVDAGSSGLSVVEGVPELSPASLAAAGIKMEVTKEDLLAILTDEATSKLDNEIRALDKSIKSRQKEALDRVELKIREAMATTMRKLGMETKVSFNFGNGSADASLVLGDVKVRVAVQASLINNEPVPASLVADIMKLEELNTSLRFIRGNPDKFRARISKIWMSGTLEGRKVLESLKLVTTG